MNSTNADTLARIMKMRRSESPRAGGVVRSHSTDQKTREARSKTIPPWKAIGRLEESGWMLVGSPSLIIVVIQAIR
jgi:hypothetical protein